MDELETSLATTAAHAPAAQKELLTALKAELKVELRAALEHQLAPAIKGQLGPAIEDRLAAAIDEKLPNAIAQQVMPPQQLPTSPPAENGPAAQPVASEGGAAALLAAHAVRKDRLKAELGVTLEGTPAGTAGSQAQPPTPAANAAVDLAACGGSEATSAPKEQAANGCAGSAVCSGAGSSAWHATLGPTDGSREAQVASPAAAHVVPLSPAAPVFTPSNGQLSATAATFTPAQTTPAQEPPAQTPPPVECGGVGGATAAVAASCDAGCSSQAAPSLTDVMRLMQEGKQACLPHTQPIDDKPLASPPPASISSLRPQAKPWERPFLPMPGASPMIPNPRIEELPH